LNPDSTAARVTDSYMPETEADVRALAELADRLLRLPILYIEYSGIYGNMALVQRIRDSLTQARLLYGGGIDGAAKAQEACKAADTIVIGNLIYRDLEAAIQTVRD